MIEVGSKLFNVELTIIGNGANRKTICEVKNIKEGFEQEAKSYSLLLKDLLKQLEPSEISQ